MSVQRQRTRKMYLMGMAGAWVPLPCLSGSLRGIGFTNFASVIQRRAEPSFGIEISLHTKSGSVEEAELTHRKGFCGAGEHKR